jgi:Na+-driven multidrug efflux pump
MSIFQAEPEVVDIAVMAFRYIAITMPFFGYAVTINVLFQAIGRGLPAALLSLSRQGIFYFPIIFVLPKFMGLTGVLLTQPAADVFTIILTFILGIRVMREIKQLERDMPEGYV